MNVGECNHKCQEQQECWRVQSSVSKPTRMLESAITSVKNQRNVGECNHQCQELKECWHLQLLVQRNTTMLENAITSAISHILYFEQMF